MADGEWAPHYSPDPNILERKAGEYLQDWNEAQAGKGRDRAMAAVRSLERRTVLWACLAGILSGALIGGAEVYLRQGLFGSGIEEMDWRNQLPYWIVFYVLVGIVSAVEIAFLYWNSLRSIGKATCLAGTKMDNGPHGSLIASGLARAALEFPNPRVSIHGIDPYALVPGWQLAVRNILYKMKVGVSSFLLRVALRRVLARAVLRGFIPLLAIPLYAVWNGFITWRIMREAHIRALGPLVVEEALSRLPEGREEAAGMLLLHGCGELMMRGRDAHPNHFLLLSRLVDAFNIEDETIEVDWPGQREALAALDEADQRAMLDVLILAALLGGKVRSAQKEFLADACEAAERRFDEEALERLRRAVLNGDPIMDERLRAVIGN